MINKLRKRLIFIYTCSTGIILTAVLFLTLFITNQQLTRNKKEAFQNNFMTVTQRVLMNNEISNLWLAEMEIKNHLIIHIEDGGKPLWFKGGWSVPTKRSILVEKLKQRAEKDDINTEIRLISKNEVKSKCYEFKGDKNDKYLGEVYMVSSENSYRSIIVLQYISDDLPVVIRKSAIIISLYLSGLTALFLVSRWMVGKSLKPVEESRKRQTEFIASASHELKSPLTVIRANTSAMLVEPKRAGDFIRGIDRECVRLSALIEDLLLLASSQVNSWSMKKEVVDMDILLIETYDSFLPLIQKNNKKLKLELPEAMLPRVSGDELRMKQILTVLLDNAVAYSKEGDSILLRAYPKKHQLLIEVEDHGAGIEESMKREIFEKFYRGDRSRRDKSHFGLGLSIAKELTELHGGNISLRDTNGGGTTFIVSLPVYKKKESVN